MKFVASFCNQEFIQGSFTNELAKFTPCFTDVIVLGIAYVVSVILCLVRITQLSSKRTACYKVKGWTQAVHILAVAVSAACIVIHLMQFSARLLQSQNSALFVEGPIAPFEWLSYGVSFCGQIFLTATLGMELGTYKLKGAWLVKFSFVLVCAAQIAKLRFVVELVPHQGYFFVMYMVYFSLQGLLAVFGMFHRASPQDLVLISPGLSAEGYQLLSEEGEKGEYVCPETYANIFSRLTFAWIGKLIRDGFKAPLQFADIWSLPPNDRNQVVGSTFQSYWDKEMLNRGGPVLWRAIWNTVKWLFISALPLKLITDLSQFVGPFFINLLLGQVDKPEAEQNRGLIYFYAVLMFVGLMIGTFSDNQQFQLVMRAGFRLRSALVAAIYRKVLFLTPSARSKFASGRIYNMVSSDAENIQMICQSVFGFISAPFRIILAMVMLYMQLKYAAFMALGVLIVMMPIQGVMVRFSTSFLRKTLAFTDERTKLEADMVEGMEVVKCAAWEQSFLSRINSVRGNELKELWKSFVLSAVNTFLLQCIPTIVAVSTFAVYVLLGNSLTAATAFTSLSLFNVLRMPLIQLPQLIMQLVNVQVAFKRISDFLKAEQQQSIEIKEQKSPSDPAVRIQGSFTWSEDEPPYLRDIDLTIAKGKLVAVVGSTGSGKSSLLNAILGLLSKVEGQPLSVLGKIAYVPQTPFIFNATVKENILFGREYNEEEYNGAVSTAALLPDFQQFVAGDETELGERGLNVSGGQKQRISLARAVYAHADVYLLDDPLSALDAKVAQQVFRTCLKGELSDKTRILVTNLLQFAISADVIIFMQDGKIAEMGSYKELMDLSGGFAQLMAEATVEEEDEKKEDDKKKQEEISNGQIAETGSNLASAVEASKTIKNLKPAAQPPKNPTNSENEGQLTEKEQRATGLVRFSVIGAWVRGMGGPFVFIILILLYVLSECFRVGATVWLSVWTAWSQRDTAHGPFFYLDIYAGISLAQVLVTLANEIDLRRLSIRASKYLHDGMLNCLLRAPMSFFHTTPSGRIINRLSKDTSDVDRNLAFFASFFFRSLLMLISTVVLVGVITPFTLPILVPIMLFFYFLYIFFQTSVREVKRLDSVSRSPMYTSIGEAISGLSTIRAFGAEQRLMQHNSKLLDDNIVMSLVNQSMNRWLGVRLETLGALTALAAALLSIEEKNSASQFGLALSYALQITAYTNMVIRLASLAENSFNAVERVDEYSQVPPEADLFKPGTTPDGWPRAGTVKFQEVQMRYRPGLPLVLKGLSVQFEAGMKCGVVGRTGAGKSSLINSLFRLAELDEGQIVIDGVDTGAIGLHQLRKAMAIIPQNPTIFTGTVRFNLSPFGDHSDDQIWLALQRAYLAPVIQAQPEGLDLLLQEGGSPLSAGQKQLLALARALLRGSKILILDEATANVDVETDALIQKTIRTEFAGCTIIAIAHRLHTIIDCDCILVMDQGQTAEFGSPAQLLNDAKGVFTSMVHETGEATERFLRSVAFGEVDLNKEYEEEAEKGLARIQMASHVNEDCTGSSQYLVEKAKATAKVLHALMENLRFSTSQRSTDIIEGSGQILAPGNDPEQFARAAEQLKEAVSLVDDIAHLAECAQAYFQSQGVELDRQRGLEEGRRESVSDQEWVTAMKQVMENSTRAKWAKIREAVSTVNSRRSTMSSLPPNSPNSQNSGRGSLT